MVHIWQLLGPLLSLVLACFEHHYDVVVDGISRFITIAVQDIASTIGLGHNQRETVQPVLPSFWKDR